MTHRIAQWTVGNIGKAAIEAMRDDPGLELVACYARPGDKTGKDAGELAGVGPIGVPVVSTIEEVIAARPDVVLYMPLMWDVDAMARLLEAGINVISTANFITGYSYGPEDQQRLHEAALRGGVSLYGTGANPGAMNVLALAATQVCRQIKRIFLFESVDASGYNSPDTWRSLGFGGPKDAPGLLERVRTRTLVFADAVEMMAKALGTELDDILFEGELGVATEDLDLGYMTIEKGMACGMKILYVGMHKGQRVIEVGTMTRLGKAMAPDWTPQHGYQIEVEGAPSIKTVVHCTDAGTAYSNFYTCMTAINAIPAVVAAKPGLVIASDLPLIVAKGRLG
jgi:hypothetical protein